MDRKGAELFLLSLGARLFWYTASVYPDDERQLNMLARTGRLAGTVAAFLRASHCFSFSAG